MWLGLVIAWQTLATYDVEVTACQLDTTELKRLTTLELRSAGAPSLEVSYACEGADVTIGLRNPESGILIERLANSACCDDVEAERTLALLARGLFNAAGDVLAKPKPEEAPKDPDAPDSPAAPPEPDPLPPTVVEPPPKGAPPPPRAPAPTLPPQPVMTPAPSPATATADLPERTADHIHVLGFSGRVQAFNMSDPTMTYGVGVDYRAWPWRTIGFGGFVNAHFGSSNRTGGEVMSRVIDIGAVAAWRFLRWPTFTLATEVSGGLSIVSIEGRAATEAFASDGVTGASGSLGLAFVPSVIFDRTRVALPVGFGALFRAPRGAVGDEASGEALQLDGLRLGGALRVSLGFLERDDEAPVVGGRAR